jgi:protein tyrosine/serine phosphatase
MQTIYRGTIHTKAGRRNAWMDALFIDHAVLRTLWTNFHTVAPGALYRANHPTPGNLRRFTRKAGLKTLINLRGATGNGSDALSREAAHQLGLDFIDLPMRSHAAPKREQILALGGVFQRMRRPALVHCKSGADRAGFAAAIFLILEGHSTAEAKRQLSLRYGHLRHAKTGILDRFLEVWAQTGEGRKPFLQWVAEEYDEAALIAGFATNPIARFINDRILVRE